MQRVGAGPADGVDHRAGAAKLRAIRINQSLEFGNRVNTHGGAQHGRTATAIPGVLHVLVIEQHGLTVGTSARNGKAI